MPDSKTCPELHVLVTKYQMHKCSDYCKRRRRVGSTFITRCKFDFPRPECDGTRVSDVSDSLRKRERIYHLKHLETKGRVNDYKPLLLLLWKANIDVQYVSECSLALAQYVSGYVTKAERSSMQNCGKRSATPTTFTANSSVLDSSHCVHVIVACTRTVTFFLVTICAENRSP